MDHYSLPMQAYRRWLPTPWCARIFQGVSKTQNIGIEQDIFAILGLGKPLLGCPAIEALAIVTLIEPVAFQSDDIVQQFPKMFRSWKVYRPLSH